jgi:hypothetical protein
MAKADSTSARMTLLLADPVPLAMDWPTPAPAMKRRLICCGVSLLRRGSAACRFVELQRVGPGRSGEGAMSG